MNSRASAIVAVEDSRAYKKPYGWQRRTADCKYATDVVYRQPDKRQIAISAGAPGEQQAHYEKFAALRGLEDAHRIYDEVWWWAFRRGEPEPCEVSRWL